MSNAHKSDVLITVHRDSACQQGVPNTENAPYETDACTFHEVRWSVETDMEVPAYNAYW